MTAREEGGREDRWEVKADSEGISVRDDMLPWFVVTESRVVAGELKSKWDETKRYLIGLLIRSRNYVTVRYYHVPHRELERTSTLDDSHLLLQLAASSHRIDIRESGLRVMSE